MFDNQIEPLTVSIDAAAALTGESPWSVREKLRLGVYRAKKSGRRTLVVYSTIRDHLKNLPDASFGPSEKGAGRNARGHFSKA